MTRTLAVRTRLAIGFGTTITLLAIILALALWSMVSLRSGITEIVTNWMPSTKLLSDMNKAKSDVRLFELRHLMVDSDEARAQATSRREASLAYFETQRQAYVKLISSPEEQRIYDSFMAQWTQYLQLGERVRTLSQQGDPAQARALLFGESRQVYDRAATLLSQKIELNWNSALAEGRNGDEVYASARATLLVAALLAIATALAGALWVARSIMRELGGEPAQVAVVAQAIANADLRTPIAARPGDSASVVAAMARMQLSLRQTVLAVRGSSDSVATASAQIAQGNHDLSQRTEEQAAALQQTAASMEELSTTVRQNAALVEESAAAAESLKGQAMQLVQAVAVFKLGEAQPG